MNHRKSILTILILSAGFALPPSGHAQIGLQDGGTNILVQTTAGSPLSDNFTVTSGASVLVVTLMDKGASAAGAEPASLIWGSQTIAKAVTEPDTSGAFRDITIYYLFNPTPGTHTITISGITGAGLEMQAYTLSGVSTGSPPITTAANVASATTLSTAPTGITANSWAVLTAVYCSSGGSDSLALSASAGGGAVAAAYDNTDDGTGFGAGYVSGLASGSANTLTATETGGAANKMVIASAVFSPTLPTPPAPTVTATIGNPAVVNLSWTPSSNALTYTIARGLSAGGLSTYTTVIGTNYSDSNVVSGTTYYYEVGAGNSSGTNYSTPATSATPVGTPFAPVLGLGAAGAGNLKLHWLEPNASSYTILRGTTSGGEVQIASGVTTNIYLDSGLTAGTTYYYEVEAVGPGGTSAASDEASAVALGSGWFLFDNFSLDSVGAALNGQTGSAGLGVGWTNVLGGVPINVLAASNGLFGANYAQYVGGATTDSGDYEAGLGISGTATASTVFLEFNLPGIQPAAGSETGTNVVAMNFDIFNANPPTQLFGNNAAGPSAQFNYDNTAGNGQGYFRVYGGSTVYFATIAPTATPYAPTPGNLYYFWFVMNAASGTYQIYLADGSMTGTNVDSGGLGTSPTLMWGATSMTSVGTLNTFGFRNIASGGTNNLAINFIGTGPGTSPGTVPQNELANIFVDQHAQNLANPITGLPPLGAPVIFIQPQSLQVLAGAAALFTIEASTGVTYQWQYNNVNINNATNSSLTITNAGAGNLGNYTCVIENPATAAFLDSSPASLTIATPIGAYETAAIAATPEFYYAFNDTENPASGTAVAYEWVSGDNGVYGANVENGSTPIDGPTPSAGFSGFSTTNYAAQFRGENEPNNVTIDYPWNLNTNVVSLTAWINPSTSTEPSSTAVMINRGTGSDVEGLTYNNLGDFNIGYTWADDPNTYGWDSFLQPPANMWSFVALTVTPTNAVITMMNANGIYTATHNYAHPVEPFAGATMIGDDPASAIGAQTFNGIIDEVGIYNSALSTAELQTLFFDGTGSNATQFPAGNTVNPASLTLYPGQTAVFSAVVEGAVPITNVWQVNNVNLSDGPNAIGMIIGSSTPNLTISNLAAGDAGQTYNVTLETSDGNGSFTTATASTLTVQTTGSAQTITTLNPGVAAGFEAAGTDWNTGASWSDGNPADVSIYSEPGSTYEIVPGTMERSPVSTNAVFPSYGNPANALVIEGDGVFMDGGLTNFDTETNTGELRLKEDGTATALNFGTTYTAGGSVTFPNLVLAGGQIDNGNPSAIIIDGQIDVIGNSTFYADSASGASIRSFVINALLSGSGTLTYEFLGTASSDVDNDIDIANPNNTFTGRWNVGPGGLLGSASASLGTNSITVNADGSLETTYDLDSPNATLTLNGQMYLYTSDTFKSVSVDGLTLYAGTYTFAELNNAFPAVFPSSWTVQLGSTTGTNSGSVGSIQVLSPSAPSTITLAPPSAPSAGSITLSGSGGPTSGFYPNTFHVLTTTNLSLPLQDWTVLSSGTFSGTGTYLTSVPVGAGDQQQFFVIKMP